MRALSATTNVVVGGTSTISSSFLSFARSAAEAATLSTSAGVERLRPHLEPPGLALGEREHVAEVGVEQERRAADATDQFIVGVGRGAAPHRQDVEGGDDALQGERSSWLTLARKALRARVDSWTALKWARSCSIARTL